MAKAKFLSSSLSKPLICKSNKLCASCLYLFTSIFLALYISISPTSKCLLFRNASFDPVRSPLFTYPSSYGEHKHVLPTYRSSCSSPIAFSDYSTTVKGVRQSCRNWTHLPLRYMQGKGDTFGGNLSLERRVTFFDQQEQLKELPCGFFKSFVINQHDQDEMNNCKEVVVVSAIFGDHDKIRQPKGLGSTTLEMTCFFMFVDDATLKGFFRHNLISKQPNDEYNIGVWRLINVSLTELYRNPAMNGVIPKYLIHRLFPNAKYSIWVDAKLQLVVDPLLLLYALVIKKDVDMAISRHPFFIHTMEEALATTRWRKLVDIEAVKMQMENYCENGLRPWSPSKLPYPSDVPDTALILRKHGVGSNLFSCLMFSELDAFSHRDQLAFAYVRDKMKPKVKINMFDVEVFEQIVLEFRHNLKHGANASGSTGDGFKIKRATPDKSGPNGLGKCYKYFLEMWGESHA